MDKAKEKLRYEGLSEEEKKKYQRFQHNLRIEKSVEYTKILEAEMRAGKRAEKKQKLKSLKVQ